MAEDHPPRNTCQQHLLCVAHSCQSLPLPNSSYCEQHDRVQCSAFTKRGNKCPYLVISQGNRFCSDHQKQENPVEAEWNGICNSKNNRGARCKAPPLPGKPFCKDHQNKSRKVDEIKAPVQNTLEKAFVDMAEKYEGEKIEKEKAKPDLNEMKVDSTFDTEIAEEVEEKVDEFHDCVLPDDEVGNIFCDNPGKSEIFSLNILR